jgi:hypothetical protein
VGGAGVVAFRDTPDLQGRVDCCSGGSKLVGVVEGQIYVGDGRFRGRRHGVAWVGLCVSERRDFARGGGMC